MFILYEKDEKNVNNNTASDINTNKDTNIFKYGALIFIMAIVMILIAFFGQSNLKKTQPEDIDSTNGSISERAAALSEENRLLLEENTTLNDENNTLYNDLANQVSANSQLQAQYDSLKVQNDINIKLLQINSYISVDSFDKAMEIYSTIYPDSLTSDQRILFDQLTEILADNNG